jgi:hypothetical protein
VTAVLVARLGKKAAAIMLAKIADRTEKSRKGTGPTAYKLGACAAQGALVFALDKKALPGAMTERYYNNEGKSTKDKILHDVIDPETKVRIRDVSRVFKSGETVPPCKTCELVVPVLICPEPKEQCGCGG